MQSAGTRSETEASQISNSGALALKAHAAEHRGKKNLAIFASKKFGCEKIVRPGVRPPPHIRG